MQSLTQLALQHVSLRDLWNSGIITLDLPNDSPLLQRVTLDNVVSEGLLEDDDIPEGLMAIVLQRNSPEILWFYITGIEDEDDVNRNYPNPFSIIAEDFALQTFGIIGQEFRDRRSAAIRDFAADLLLFLQSDGQSQTYNNGVTVIWDQQNGIYRLFIIDPDADQEYSLNVSFHDKIGDLIEELYYNALGGKAMPIISDRYPPDIDSLEKYQRIALESLGNGIQEDTNDLWPILRTGQIITTEPLSFAISDLLGKGIILRVIGEYLYIIDNSNYQQYNKDDALLIVTSLYYNHQQWIYTADPLEGESIPSLEYNDDDISSFEASLVDLQLEDEDQDEEE